MTTLADKEWFSAMTSIYDGATDASLWGHAADSLRDIVESKGCLLMLSDHEDQAP